MIQDDSLLNEFLQEARDHLLTIESDLLIMETDGANADENLVNKVFRAAHSIKGGSGFFSLDNIGKLAHRLENALDMIRNKEMVSTPEVVNILLLGFDRLREMINNIAASEGMEIEDLVVALTGLATTHLPADEKQTLTTTVPLPPLPGRTHLVTLNTFDLNHASKKGKNIFLIELDLFRDVQHKGKTPWSLFKELIACGSILDCAYDTDTVGTLDDEPSNAMPMQLLYCTVLEADLVASLVDIPSESMTPVPVPKAPKPKPKITVVTAVATVVTPGVASAVAPEPPPQITTSSLANPVAVSPASANPAPSGGSATNESATGETTLRVSLAVLEQLMNLAGEMVLGRNQLMAAISSQDPRAIQAGAQRINFVTSEMQEAIMLTRMQPVGNVLNRFPRVVRDLCRELGKEIQLQISGKEVEIDRTILEGLSDPLTHMVRNSVDHGIEMPARRQELGKKPMGTVDIRVFQEAGQVIVEIRDDGKGLDTARIAAKAVEKGLITQEQMRSMSTKEQMALVLLPGLSTADQVSNLSGRGVGMDVVKTNIEKLGGTIDIESDLGRGSTFRIKLPLTLAIVPSLLVSVDKERFAIPQVNVAELIRIAPDQLQHRIEVVGETEVLLLRGQLVPLVRLAEVLGIGTTFQDPVTGERANDRRQSLADRRSRKRDAGNLEINASVTAKDRNASDRRFHATSHLNVVVVNAGELQYGIVVEALHDTVEIVVKPLGRHLKSFREYAGATILGDGGVALIVDVVSLAGIVGMTSQGGTTRAVELADDHAHERFRDRHAFLLFQNAPGEACAVPLEQVARVERVERRQIERAGGRRTMQYRGGSLPLVSLKDTASVGEFMEDQEMVVIVFSMSGREVGLLGALPVDSMEVDVPLNQQIHRQLGIAGSMIIHERTTLILDIHEIVAQSLPDALPPPQFAASGEGGQSITILLAEDSDFFRNQVKKFLESDGYQVITAEDGQFGWERLLEHEAKIQAVITDIEMPRLNGFEFVQRIRADARFANLPVIAVTSLAGEDDVLRGKAAGFNDYQIKLDKERLLECLSKYLSPALTRSE